MRAPTFQDLPRPLSSDLVLKRASSQRELEAVLAGHLDAFGDEDDAALRANLCSRPGSRPDNVLYVEDVESGRVVSSLSLIPQTWAYEGIPIAVGEVGIVSTRKAYRKRGVVREQFEEYHRLARQAGCLISVIMGIPYFYRQFGYEYIIPMGGDIALRPEQVPDPPQEQGQEPAPAPTQDASSGVADSCAEKPSASPYTFRVAGAEHMPILQRFYAELTKDLCVTSIMPGEIWLYQDGLPESCGDRKITYLVERGGEPLGYVRMAANELSGWAKGVVIYSAYLPHHELCLAALRFAKRLALEERKEKRIRIRTPIAIPLIQLAADLGGELRPPYAWQVRVLDPVGFMLTIAPVLERRLAESVWAGLSQDWVMGMYRENIVLRFREGRLLNVATAPHVDKHDLRCPPEVMPMIWLGYRSVQEIVDWYPDAHCKDKDAGRLASVLFPKRDSWACSQF